MRGKEIRGGRGKGREKLRTKYFFFALCVQWTLITHVFKVTVKTFDMINELFIENVKSKNLLDKKEYKK